ncbi:MAG: hypothetical protein PVI07_08645, partial [Anaerolineae bacterium]
MRYKRLLGVVVLLLLANVVILGGCSRLLMFAAGLVLTCLLPGYLLTQIALGGGGVLDWIEEATLTVGLGFSVLVLGTLGLHYLPGPLIPAHVLTLYDSLTLLL